MVTDLLDRSTLLVTALTALFAYGTCPGLFLRLIVTMFHPEDPRRRELVAELYAVPRRERPIWVFEQLEVALSEGLWRRLESAATGRLFDRWTLTSGLALHRQYPDSFEIPSEEEKRAIEPGVAVKLIFRMTLMRRGEGWAERMWVDVEKVSRRHLVGRLINEPAGIPRLAAGQRIRFKPSDIVDIQWEPSEPCECCDTGGYALEPLHAACNGLDGSHECSRDEECSDISHSSGP